MAATVLAAHGHAADPPPDHRLKQLEGALERGREEQEELRQKARALATELADLDKELVAAARLAQEHEETLSELEVRLGELRTAETERAAALDRRQRQMVGVLTAIERLAWRPTEALIAQPTSPAETVRSAILLRAVLPRIEESAAALRQELDDLAALRGDIARKRQQAAHTQAKIDQEQKRLTALLKRKRLLQQSTEEKNQTAERRLATMAAEAKDLRELMARLEAERKQREEDERRRAIAAAANAALQQKKQQQQQQAALAVQPFDHRQGGLPLPARGRVVAQFGQANAVGSSHKGMTIETRQGGQIIAPADGHVVFAGTFRGYGQLLIIEHGEGYHTLLAGMTRIDCKVGQHLLGGEPVGVMGGSDDDKPSLYFELRRNGQPVNPLPWLAARKDKVSG